MPGQITNPLREFTLEVSKGNVDGHKIVHVHGHNVNVGTTRSTLWSIGTADYVYPAAAGAMTLSSTSANDTVAGTGARTVKVEYLDGNYAEQTSDTMDLNGQTGVTILKGGVNASILRVHKIKVITAGTGLQNAGDIYVGTGAITAGVPANKYGFADAGYNRSQMAMYTVPAGKTAYIMEVVWEPSASKSIDTEFVIRPQNEVFRVEIEMHGIASQTRMILHEAPLKVVEKSDMELRAEISTGTTELSGGFHLILVDN